MLLSPYDPETKQFKAECLTDSTVAIMRDKLEFGVQDGYNVYIDQAADGSGVAVADTYRTPTIKIDGVDVPVAGAASAPVAPDGSGYGGGPGIVVVESGCFDPETNSYKRECLDRSVTEWGQQNLAVGYTVDSTLSQGVSGDGLIAVGVQDQYTRPVLYVAGTQVDPLAGGEVGTGFAVVTNNIPKPETTVLPLIQDMVDAATAATEAAIAEAVASVNSSVSGITLTAYPSLSSYCQYNDQGDVTGCTYDRDTTYSMNGATVVTAPTVSFDVNTYGDPSYYQDYTTGVGPEDQAAYMNALASGSAPSAPAPTVLNGFPRNHSPPLIKKRQVMA